MTRYYVYDGESYDASYTTPEEARKAAIRALDGWRNDAETNDGWADEAASVAWGEVREIATLIPHAGAVEEDGLDDRGVDYELRAPDDDLTHAALTTPEGYVGAVSEAVAEELERVRADFAALRVEHEAVRKERDSAHEYTAKLTEDNVKMLRWMSVASGAHIDHLCNMVKSLAVSEEGLASLRAISADGVVDEIRRAFAAECIGRELSDDACQRHRGELAQMEGRALDAERERDELRAALDTFRSAWTARAVARRAVTEWMDAEAREGRLRTNCDAPGWAAYDASERALSDATSALAGGKS